jgi:hypothetical protein
LPSPAEPTIARIRRMGIGEEGLDQRIYARLQLEGTRSDPRLTRGRGSMIADYHEAVEEVERLRFLMEAGLHELSKSLEREEAALGVGRNDPHLTSSQTDALQAAWERAELARAEITNELPYVHAVALVGLQSALDALVEELVPAWRGALEIESRIARLDGDALAAWQSVPEDKQHLLKQAMAEELVAQIPKKTRRDWKPKGGEGANRYETALEHAGLHAGGRRPVPDDLDVALAELNALRNVIVHRAGRVDAAALQAAPGLPYAEGDFVRVSRAQYRMYSAAAQAYGAEVIRRLMRDLVDDVDLRQWRHHAKLGT